MRVIEFPLVQGIVIYMLLSVLISQIFFLFGPTPYPVRESVICHRDISLQEINLMDWGDGVDLKFCLAVVPVLL